ncbi:MAG: undecaprenyl-diphosphate phosphatase [Bacteroidia bacterium]|nr:undecaprenyl-diphosphate phosphatase [Bacteroidia bacterium]
MNILQAIILAIIEGITEYLPVSSTGHMIVASSLFGIEKNEFVKLYTVAIQFGAILSVVVLYWKKFLNFKEWSFYFKLIIAVIPALIFGKLFGDYIDEMLEKPLFIGIVFLLGGIVLLNIDKWFSNPVVLEEKEISYLTAFKVGIFQVLAIVFPGLSRSAATIIGGMSQKLSREVAAEFSFFLAVPTMAAATLYTIFLKDITIDGKEIKGYELMLSDTTILTNFLIGNVIAFIVAFIAVKSFIGLISKYGFKYFGIYRIIAGIIVILLCITGVIG